jgi:VWFA-related protein
MRALLLTLASAVFLSGTQQGAPTPTAAQQRPVFRGGTHFVRVDAYPSRNGKIVEGLTPDDFEITEDGRLQKIESFDFIKYPTFTPDAERRDWSSQRGGYDLAADPRYRVFVIVVNIEYTAPGQSTSAAVNSSIGYIQQPLIRFLDRVLGPQDVYGFLTTAQSAKDLVLGQKITSVEAQIADMWRASAIDRDEEADALLRCGPTGEAIRGRFLLDRMYTSLETLVVQLGSLRQERKNVIFVANRLDRPREDRKILSARGPVLPKAGIVGGRVGIGDRSDYGANESMCASEVQRLALMDFDSRYRQLLREARQQNVSFFPVTPAGLQAPATLPEIRAVEQANDDLITLAHETDGIPIVDTNDLAGGMTKIADDLAAYYLLGYYTTNTTWDGGIRTIKVKLKTSGEVVRARRQYRAPTQAEIDALSAKAAAGGRAPSPGPSSDATARETALGVLERASRPFAAYAAVSGKTLTVIAELSSSSIQLGRWKSGADVEVEASGPNGEPAGTARGRIDGGSYAVAIPVPISGSVRPARVAVRLVGPNERPTDDWLNVAPSASGLVGDAIAYRSASRVAKRPVAAFEFARNERITVEWPVLAPLDRREARLLDHTGKPLPVDLPLSEDSTGKVIVLDMSLSGLPHGDYLFELTAGSGGTIEKHLLAIRVK